MKRFLNVLLVLLLFMMMIPRGYAREKTLNELLREAEANRVAYNQAKNQKIQSEAERDQALADKAKTQEEIKNIEAELDSIQKEIDRLKDEIVKKDKQMKEIMGFVQVSNGESNYLEYIFGATDFTDFIYRVSVAEQLGDYNEKLIESYNNTVNELDQKQTELNKKQEELNKKLQELSILEAKLNEEISSLKEGMVTKDTEYKTQISLIENLRANGCNGDDTLSSCLSRKSGSGVLPSTGSTFIPVEYGYITSDYGDRIISGYHEFHTGIDFGANPGTKVYAAAPGEVVATVYNPSCGNHMVYVKHNINGHSYVTSYWHMSTFLVRSGYVDSNTPIGLVAASASVTGDRCGGGAHVHLNLFDNANRQWELSAARGYPNANRINPHIALNIPYPQKDGSGGYIPYRVSHF